ncbi:NAD-binding protein [Gymnopilus junonius]|uniref:NAD-binding protein n=1 Tax=Gymnopilus junonius TaxID=109634 RepID=A0A9P5NTT8_GYMJU|nr:NAD-binding protein [Gymnopilus junonius]
MSSYKSISEDDLTDLHGKVAIVTGGNTGIGYGTVQFLARKGAKVYIAARNEQKALDAIKQLEKEGIADGKLEWLKLDLSDPRIAKKAAQDFLEKETRLDILVNNAALGPMGPFSLDQDGLLGIMVTNHISHFIFTDTLLPLLKTTSQKEGSDVRIINISSNAHDRNEVISFEGKESLNKDFGNSVNGRIDTYGYSKLANILHIKELQRRLDSENVNIVCVAVHPGSVWTSGVKSFLSSIPYLGKLIEVVFGSLFKSWRQGAYTSVFAAASPEVRQNKDLYKGAYLTPVAKITKPSKSATNAKLATELYDTTESVLKELGVLG